MYKKWLVLLSGTILLFNISCKKDPVSSIPATVTFQDANFETLIREAINKPTEDILTADMLTIIKLDGEDREISNIAGIEHCTNLDTLHLLVNMIDDISPLTALTSLIYLDLDENQISDISHLNDLTMLTKLWLSDNQIIDISPLSSLANLQTLHLDFNQIININALSGLSKLDHLSLWDNQITDISYLIDLASITYLDLEDNQISDISALSNLENIRLLFLSDNQISDIYPLTQNSGFDDGGTIYLRNNPLSETSINTYIPQLEALGVDVTYGDGKVRSNINNKHNNKN